jgi:hypothetical protein
LISRQPSADCQRSYPAAAGDIDAGRFDTGVAGLLAAKTDTELAEVVRSLPQPVVFTSPDRRLAKPLEIHSGMGRLRLAGQWQAARETHVSADLGSVMIEVSLATRTAGGLTANPRLSRTAGPFGGAVHR